MTVTHTAEPTSPGILLAEAIDIDTMLSLRHLARQFSYERDALEKALSALQNASLSEKNARLAVAHWALGQTGEAESMATKESSSALAQVLCGMISEDAKKFDAALKFYQKAAQLAPTNPPCVLRQVSALRQLDRVDDALETLESLRREFSDQANFAYFEGRCLEDSGLYQKALESYQQAVAMNPQHADSLYHAARLCDLRGLDDEARRYYEKIGSGQGSTYVNACLNLSLIYEDIGDYEKAANCCQRVLNIDPNNARAKMFLSDTLSSSNMYYSPEETKQSERLEAVLRVPVSDFELSVRSRNCLAKMNIMSLGDLVKKTESEMLAYKNFGETSLREIKEMLLSRGLRLGMMREDAATRAAMERKRHGANQEILDKSINEMELSVRSRKAMERLNIRTIGDLLERSEAEMASVKNFGRISLNEIKRRLTEMGLSLKGSR